MTDAEKVFVLDTILTHGLAIRQVPWTVAGVYEMRHYKPDNPEYEVVDYGGRTMCRRTQVPLRAGYWMCQTVESTTQTVLWNYKDHHIAPTLLESVQLYLASLEKKDATA